MKPGLRMMMIQDRPDGRRMDSDDPNRRRIGFGANGDEERRRPRRNDWRREDPRRNEREEPYRMMGDEYQMREGPETRNGMPYYPGRPVWPGMVYTPSYGDDDGYMAAHRGMDHQEHGQHRRGQYDKRDAYGQQDGEQDRYEMTRDKAVEWMEHLKNEDPAHPTGPRWTMEEVKPYAAKHGVEDGGEEFVEFWVAMNMLYSDYYAVFKEYNLATPDAFAKMAKAFLHDKDAMDHKLGRYYCGVVRK